MRSLRMIVFALVATLVASWVVSGNVTRRILERRLADATGLVASAGSASVEWRRGRVALGDVVLRSPDGVEVVRVATLGVGLGALGGGRPLVLDGAEARGVTAPGVGPVDVLARGLAVRRAGNEIAVDATLDAGPARIVVEDGRLDPATGTVTIARLGLAGVAFASLPRRSPIRAERLVARRLRVGASTVERLVADGVGVRGAPERLRALVRVGDGTVRVRWNRAAPRLDVRLGSCPVPLLAGALLTDARLEGAVVTGSVHVGRVAGAIDARLRAGSTRLERAGESWLGWSALSADVRRFDVGTRRLLDAEVAVTEPVALVRHDASGTWPLAGWASWITPGTADGLAAAWAALQARFAVETERAVPATGATLALARGRLTLADATTERVARVTIHDLDARAHWQPARGVEARLEARVGDAGAVSGALTLEPAPRARLALRNLPTDAPVGWDALGRALLGVPLGRALALAETAAALDLAVDVEGDPTEKRFGLVTKAVEELRQVLRDRVTEPLLAAAELERDGEVETIRLPVVTVDPGAPTLSGDAADVADRVAVLLAQYPELSARVEGRFAADEPSERGTARAAAVARHLATLGLEGRVVVGPVGAGAPGVAIVLGGRVS